MWIPEMNLEPPESVFVDYESEFYELADKLYEEQQDELLLLDE